MSSLSLAPQEHRLTRYALLTGHLLALFLVISVLIRYPGNAISGRRYLELGAIALFLLLALTGWLLWRGTRTRSARTAFALRQGTRNGLLCGLLWVLEISFNNFLPPTISTGAARFYVDNSFWALIACLMIVVSAISAFRHKSLLAGIQVGFWSGLVSGLIACLMGLLLITLWMNFLLRDPLNIAEFAVRGATSGAPNMATYLAYETLTGSLGHLTILGIGMGTILGSLGGGLGAGFAIFRKPSPNRSL